MHQTLSPCFPAGLVACGWLHLIGRRSLMIRRRVPVSEETNANVPEPITEDEPVRAYTPELLYIDRPLVFPVPIFIHKHERTISRIVVPELLNHQCIALLFVSMMLPELLRRYVWGTIRPKANADELFWGDFRRFHTKGNHRIRDGTKEANKPKL